MIDRPEPAASQLDRAHVTVLLVELPEARPARRPCGRDLAQAVRFCVVGASGYAINLAVFRAALPLLPYALAFALAFAISACSNFCWNRVWTFRARSGAVAGQLARFLAVSVAALLLDLALLWALVEQAGAGKLVAAAIAIAVVTPVSFAGNRLWSFAKA